MNASNLKNMFFGGVDDEPVKRKNNTNAQNTKNINNPEKIERAKQELKEKRGKSKQTGHTKSMRM